LARIQRERHGPAGLCPAAEPAGPLPARLVERIGRWTALGASAAALAAALVLPAQASAPPARPPTLGQLVGQHLLIRMEGTTPGARLLGRIRRGEVAGVVLFRENVPPGGPAPLVARLQAAARAGGQLPLLIAIDQEGGAVKRLPGPPTLAPSAMTSAAVARSQGLATGRYLRGQGISLDLAPVLDVPFSPRAFIAGRAFSSDPAAVGSRGGAFVRGLRAGGVAAAAKHFPGLGRLVENTDLGTGRIAASRAALERDLAPFRTAVQAGVPAIMVGTAIYPAYGSGLPAACVRAIVDGLLRRTLGFRGVTLSDDLGTAGVSAVLPPLEATVRAVQAGIDLVYVAGEFGGDEAIAHDAYEALLRAARQRRIGRGLLAAGYRRVAALKAAYGA
jgi:beta-N-acetylhexosaminidase